MGRRVSNNFKYYSKINVNEYAGNVAQILTHSPMEICVHFPYDMWVLKKVTILQETSSVKTEDRRFKADGQVININEGADLCTLT